MSRQSPEALLKNRGVASPEVEAAYLFRAYLNRPEELGTLRADIAVTTQARDMLLEKIGGTAIERLNLLTSFTLRDRTLACFDRMVTESRQPAKLAA